MTSMEVLDRIAINVKSHRLLKRLLQENPVLEEIMRHSRNETEALVGVRNWVMDVIRERPAALRFFENEHASREDFEALDWRDYAAIRLLDYVDNAGRTYPDLNLHDEIAVSNPIRLIWMAVTHGTGGAKPFFFEDMLHLFRQFAGKHERVMPARETVEQWMERYPSGLDPRIVRLREENRDRILSVIVRRMERGEIHSSKFRFTPDMSDEQKYLQALQWWGDPAFHLSLAVRSPDLLNEMLGESLDPDTMKILYEARDKGIPFFVNPYYLSLLHVRVPYFAIGADLAIRHYVVYSQQLVDEFGEIVAWEKEDEVRPGHPNAAGWMLPSEHSVHRRYPDVAILIPDTVGRACGGLCASCQRMYDFQSGHLNFDLDRLNPAEAWPDKLRRLIQYFEEDSQLRDILITGGDALMSTDKQLERILEAVYEMACRKREANGQRPEEQKFAELQRVRLGTRLPVYLPQRITPRLAAVLSEFKEKATRAGVRQFVVQTHFESPLEVTPEARDAVARIMDAGWMVTNQLVLTTAASRRGHAAKLRQVLGEIGVLPYYTFSVKGYRENWYNFATNARAVQEQFEEKCFGSIPAGNAGLVESIPEAPGQAADRIAELRLEAGIPFPGSDRNVLNLPGVGKSLTFRTIGITRYGRRILEFDHDRTRAHSPVIEKMGKVIVVESKSISEYLQQLEEIGEDSSEYESLWGYSLGVTEPRASVFEYPPYDYTPTERLTHYEPAVAAD